MRYYSPRQKHTDGLWHYTVKVDDHVEPVGYCADDCPGHDTPQQAADHFKDYLLDKTSRKLQDPELRLCNVCKAYTTWRVLVGKGIPIRLILCEKHQGREHVEKLVNLHKIATSYTMGEEQAGYGFAQP